MPESSKNVPSSEPGGSGNVPSAKHASSNVPATRSGGGNVPATKKAAGKVVTPDAVIPRDRNARPYTGQKLGTRVDGKITPIPEHLVPLAVVGKGIDSPRVLDRGSISGVEIVEI